VGNKGDAITIGTIILLLLGGKGIAAKLIEVLKAYIERGNRLEFEFKKADGESISLKTENFRQRDVKELSKDMAKFFGVPE
jgi:isocitrate/isopropylmalate dehydrogenase